MPNLEANTGIREAFIAGNDIQVMAAEVRRRWLETNAVDATGVMPARLIIKGTLSSIGYDRWNSWFM